MVTRKEIWTWIRREPKKVVDLVLSQQAMIQYLQAHLAKTSANSHKPPSSDGYAKPAPKSLRQKSGLKSGGQPGHPGHSLTVADKPDHTLIHPLTTCPCGCGDFLQKQPVLRYEIRQVFDLPPLRLEVTEHRAEVKRCPQSGQEVVAPFPTNVNAPLQYGSRLLALLVYWRDQQLLPLDRISQMMADLFDHPVSQATVQAAVATVYKALANFESKVQYQLLSAPIIHADETGLRVAGKLHWLHVLSTHQLTWYGIHPKRGLKAMNDFDLLPHFTGRLIHDGWKPYFTFLCTHGLCNAHHLRELTFVHEELHQPWASRMIILLLAIHRFVAKLKTKKQRPSPAQLTRWQTRYRALLAQGRQANAHASPPKPMPQRGRPSHTKTQNLLNRLDQHQQSVLAFLTDPSVPFSNNQAEQDVRMMKVQQKISGCFRTTTGAAQFARIRSYLSTAQKNGANLLEVLIQSFQGQPFMPRAPA